MTLTLSAAGGRTVTALQLSNGIGGTWDTTTPNAAWVLGVAPSLDGALLNKATTMAGNAAVAEGGRATLFTPGYNRGRVPPSAWKKKVDPAVFPWAAAP